MPRRPEEKGGTPTSAPRWIPTGRPGSARSPPKKQKKGAAEDGGERGGDGVKKKSRRGKVGLKNP